MSPRPTASPSKTPLRRTPRKTAYSSPTKRQRPPRVIPSTPDLVNQLDKLSVRSPNRRSLRLAEIHAPFDGSFFEDHDSDKENYNDEYMDCSKGKKTPTKTTSVSPRKRPFGDRNPKAAGHVTPEKPRIAGGRVLRSTPKISYADPSAQADSDFEDSRPTQRSSTSAKRRIALPIEVPFEAVESSSSSSSFESSSDEESDYLEDVFTKPRRKSMPKGPTVTPIILTRVRPPIGNVSINVKSITTVEYQILKKESYELMQRRKRREAHPLMKYFSSVHTSAEPDFILNRDDESSQIISFITSAVSDNALCQMNRSMYISGVPGTGKTATVTKVIRGLLDGVPQATKKRKSVKPVKKLNFNYLYVNALELVKPHDIFVHLHSAVIDQKGSKQKRNIAPKTARRALDTIFRTSDRSRVPVVLVIDELDMLCNRSQDVVYDIFEWATTEEAKLVVVAIANTLDLPERVLKQRVASRMGYNRVTFQAYSYEQIDQMLQHRISDGRKYIDPNASKFIARKVASVSGDFRKALEIFRRSIEIAVDADDKKVTISHAQAAIKEGLESAQSRFTKALSKHQSFLLQAILTELRSTGLPEVDYHFVYDLYAKKCDLASIEPLGVSTALKLAKVLMQMGYIDFKSPVGSIWCKVSLRTSIEETEDMLRSAQLTL